MDTGNRMVIAGLGEGCNSKIKKGSNYNLEGQKKLPREFKSKLKSEERVRHNIRAECAR